MISPLDFSQSIMGLHGGYDNWNSRERNKNEIVLTKKLCLSGAPIDQNALRFSQMQYGQLYLLKKVMWFTSKGELLEKVTCAFPWKSKILIDLPLPRFTARYKFTVLTSSRVTLSRLEISFYCDVPFRFPFCVFCSSCCKWTRSQYAHRREKAVQQCWTFKSPTSQFAANRPESCKLCWNFAWL